MIHVCISVLRFFPYSVCFFYSHNISIFHFLRRFFKDNVKKDAFYRLTAKEINLPASAVTFEG